MSGISELSKPSTDTREDDEIDLRELFKVLWSARIWVLGITAVAAILSVVFALSLPNIYESETLLAPTSSEGSGLSGLTKQYGGLASLAGISLPGGNGGNKTVLALEIIKSLSFVTSFIQRHDILVPLMAVDGWDQLADELIVDGDVYDRSTSKWVREVSLPKQAKPSMQEAYKKFSELLSISESKDSGFVSLSIRHYSPAVAQQWVAWIVEDINNTLRAQEISEAENSIAYLKTQVAATSLTDLQSRFFEMIQSQTETIMLAKVREEYAFKTIDPAVVPEEETEPKRAIICILGTLLGILISILGVLIRHYTRK
jgi:uncharacterized protein involved in exopolysaccharide biosynthesis